MDKLDLKKRLIPKRQSGEKCRLDTLQSHDSSENKHVMVKGDASPFNGDIIYWSKRESYLYDGYTAKALTTQNHTCGHCGLKLADGERIHLHHIDRNHNNWKAKNLLVIHESCHHYIHMTQGKT